MVLCFSFFRFRGLLLSRVFRFIDRARILDCGAEGDYVLVLRWLIGMLRREV